MKTEFMAAITQLSAERNLPKEVVLSALEAALVSAYQKDAFSPEQDLTVKIDPESSNIKVYARKVVAEPVTNPHKEISFSEARDLRHDVQVGEVVEVESTPKGAGRIAAQVARQVVLQRLREAEHYATYEQFAGKEGEIITGTVQFIQPKQLHILLGKREAILPFNEQMPNEHYHAGQQLKFYLLETSQGTRGPRLVLSRSHPNFVRRLFELEIPEVNSGVVELKAIAREAGYRSKVAVSTHQEGVEPVGCCLGPRGIRLRNIINQLNGEKIDVIQWHSAPKIFISNALSPAQVASIELDEVENAATVVVPDKQLSLAIGKGGQNARLAAKLTGWRIDIKSASAAEVEKANLPQLAPERLEEAELLSAVTSEIQQVTPTNEDEGEKLDALLASDVFGLAVEAPSEKQEEKTQVRFAEDILPGAKKDVKLEKEKTTSKGHKNRKVFLEDDAQEE